MSKKSTRSMVAEADSAPRSTLSRMLAILIAGAVALGGPLAAAPAFAAPTTAPQIVEVEPDAVRLSWPIAAPSTEPDAVAVSGYELRVYAETGDQPLRVHRYEDAEDAGVETVTEDVPVGELSARLLGLTPETGYRFAVATLAADATTIEESPLSPVTRTTALPVVEEPEQEIPAEEPVPEEPVADVPAPALPVEEMPTDGEAGGDAPLDPNVTESADGAVLEEGTDASETRDSTVEDILGSAARTGESEVSLRAAADAPVLTVKGATALVVDWAAYKASIPESSFYFYSIALFIDDGETLVKTTPFTDTGSGANAGVSKLLITGLQPGTSYTAIVSETMSGTASSRSAAVSTATTATFPGALPAPPTAEATSGSELVVSWPAVESGAEVRSYTVVLFDAQGGTVSTKTGIDPFIDGTSWTFTGLTARTAYSATVRPIGYDGDGPVSAPSATVTTLAGKPTQPPSPTLAAGAVGTTDLVVNWQPPSSDGGYPITAYELTFYSGTSYGTGTTIRSVRVPGDSTSWTWKDATLVQTIVIAKVIAINEAGNSPESPASATTTAALNPVQATATPSTAVTVGSIALSEPTSDGFTLSWNAPTGAVEGTGYLVRVVEHLPTNPAGGTVYTYLPVAAPETAPLGQINAQGIIDLGTGFSTTGAQTAQITGLASATRYRVTITPYIEVDGARQYRISSGTGSSTVTTTGSTTPLAGYKALTPTATGIDSLAWTGAPLGAGYDGGSPVIGYKVAVYRSGTTAALQTVDALPDDDGNPTAQFTGLERDTAYQVAFAGVNANGVGQFSPPSDIVRTLLRPLPGTVPPPYATLAELEAAITGRAVTVVPTASAGIAGPVEANSTIAPSIPFTASTAGEIWLYGTEGASYQAVFETAAGRASASWTLDDLATGEYVLLFYGDEGTPSAVRVAIEQPTLGRIEVEDSVFRWGFNNESSNGAFFGGCNYFTAGKAPDVGSSTVFTSDRYSAQQGNVTIVKPDAQGEYQTATWADKCLTRAGVPVTSTPTTATTEQQIVITGGTGWVDPSTRSGEIQWDGDFTVVYYGGLTFWYASDPKLVVEDGVGRITVTASGYGANMFDLTKWEAIPEQEITIANLGQVRMTSTGFTVVPDYVGVSVTVEGGTHGEQAPRDPQNTAYWGSFPQDFVNFQVATGQSAYWYTSGGTQDRAKTTLPLTVIFDAEDDDASAGEGGGLDPTGPANSAEEPPAPEAPRAPLRIATAEETPVDGIESLLKLIEDGVIALRSAAEAGIPETFALGERLDFSLAWDRPDTGGVIWAYPEALYVGTFTVVDGRVTVSIDSGALSTQGEVYFVFFGDEGTVVAVKATVDGVAEAAAFEATAIADGGAAPAASLAAGLDGGGVTAETLYLLLAVGGGVLVLAGGATATVLIRRGRGIPPLG